MFDSTTADIKGRLFDIIPNMSDIHSYMGLRGPALASVIGTTAGLAFFLFGYDQGDLAGILTIPSFRRQFPQTDTIGRPNDYNVANLQGITVGIWNLVRRRV